MDEKKQSELSLTWQQVITLSEDLGRKIQLYCTKNRTAVDMLVVLPLGGLIPGERVARVLGLGDLDVAFASVAAYKPNEKTPSGTIETGQLPDRETVVGKRIWVIDEVCDTGVTLEYMIELLQSYGATEVHTAVLHYKPTKSIMGIKPDVYMMETDVKWIDYPWDAVIPS